MPPYNRPYVSPLTAVAEGNQPTLNRNGPRIAALEDNQTYSDTSGSDMGGVRIVPTSGPAPAATPADTSGSWYDRQVNALRPRLEEAAQGYGGALQAAREGQAASYDEMQRIQQERIAELSKPRGSDVWGYYGAALAAPTTTGSFGEALSNAAKAGLAQRAEERSAAERRDEKLATSKMALARMMAEKPNAQLDEFRDTVDQYKTVNEIGGYVSDMDLGNGLTPGGDEALLADYARNPRKYMGARGQQMIADARDRATAAAKTADERAWWMTQQDVQSRLKREEEAAKAAAAGSTPTPLDRSEASRVSKRLAETQSAADEASALKGDIANLRTSRDKTGYEGGWGADAYATAGGWLGLPGSSAMQEVRANAEQLRLALTQKTKGAISDSEMRIFGLATPGLNMGDEAAQSVLDAQEAAAERAVQRNMFLKAWVRVNGNDYGSDEAWATYVAQNPVISQDKAGNVLVDKSRISNWKDYITGPDGQPASSGQGQGGQPQGGQGGSQPQGLLVDPNSLPPQIKAWAEQQLRNGIPADQVIERINNHVRSKTGAPQ